MRADTVKWQQSAVAVEEVEIDICLELLQSCDLEVAAKNLVESGKQATRVKWRLPHFQGCDHDKQG